MGATGVGQREKFNHWLIEKYDHNRAVEIFSTLSEVEVCLKKRNLLFSSLFEISSEKEAKKMFISLKENKMFKISHIKKMTFIEFSMHSYLQFLKNYKQNDEKQKKEILSDATSQEDKFADGALNSDGVWNMQENKSMAATARKNDFLEWLKHKEGLSGVFYHSHVSAVGEAEQFAIEQQLSNTKLYETGDYQEAKKTMNSLLLNDEFVLNNMKQHNRYCSAIKNYLIYLSEKDSATSQSLVTEEIAEVNSPLIDEPIQTVEAPVQVPLPTRKVAMHDEEGFYQWLNKEEGMAENTCSNYVSTIYSVERFAKEHQINSAKLYGANNYWEAKETVEAILKNDKFIECKNHQQNRFRAAMIKYLKYLSKEKKQHSQKYMEYTNDLEPYKKIMEEKYPKGFRIQSGIELKKFRYFWKEKFGEELEEEDEVVRRYISSAGIQYQDFVYLPEEMLNDKTEKILITYIDNTFAEGKKAIYYDALFKEFSIEFLGQRINNSDMLKIYLAYFYKGKYFFNRSYLASDVNVEIDPVDEVRDCLIAFGAPMKLTVLYEALCNIPQKKIKQILNCNKEYIYNASEEYFHADVVELTHTELENIADLIQQAIDDKEFISGNELISTISTKYPVLMERFTMFTTVGLRDAIGFKLNGVYAFTGNIISSVDKSLSMYDVFADYCSHRDHVLLDELNNLKTELNTTIYFDAVYQNLLRINQDDFVSKDRAQFDVESTDAAIERFCTGDYVSLGEISQFGSFPDAGFPWTCYLLEHYVSDYSRNYELMHSSFNAYNCVGAIVKRNTGIKDFNDLIANVLADSNIIYTKESALQYLYDNGFLARRRYTDIEQIIINANGLRIQKGQ